MGSTRTVREAGWKIMTTFTCRWVSVLEIFIWASHTGLLCSGGVLEPSTGETLQPLTLTLQARWLSRSPLLTLRAMCLYPWVTRHREPSLVRCSNTPVTTAGMTVWREEINVLMGDAGKLEEVQQGVVGL